MSEAREIAPEIPRQRVLIEAEIVGQLLRHSFALSAEHLGLRTYSIQHTKN